MCSKLARLVLLTWATFAVLTGVASIAAPRAALLWREARVRSPSTVAPS